MLRTFARSFKSASRDGQGFFPFLPLLSLAGLILLIAETGCDDPTTRPMRSSGHRRWGLALRMAPQLSGAHTGWLEHGRPALGQVQGAHDQPARGALGLEALRGGGLIKKKSKEKHALRKKQKKSALW